MRRTAALIVGGGPAGASAAILLARAGVSHLLVERGRATGDALCGGFLSWRSLESLRALGIELDALGPARITHMRWFAGTTRVEAPLPRPAIAVSRRHLDTLLLDRAEQAGAAVERGVMVRAIEGRTARLEDGGTIDAESLFLASGKHEVRGLARPASARGSDPMIGLRVRLAAAPALDRMLGGAIELHPFDRGYVGLALQEDGRANACLAVRRSRLAEAGDPERLLDAIAVECPQLGDRFAYRGGKEPIDAVANIPYGWRLRTGTPGLFRLGDQAGVIPSLAGEGMGIAIASGIRAAHAHIAGGSAAAPAFQHRLARDLARPILVARLIAATAERPGWSLAAARLARAVPQAGDMVARLTRIDHSRLDRAGAARES